MFFSDFSWPWNTPGLSSMPTRVRLHAVTWSRERAKSPSGRRWRNGHLMKHEHSRQPHGKQLLTPSGAVAVAFCRLTGPTFILHAAVAERRTLARATRVPGTTARPGAASTGREHPAWVEMQAVGSTWWSRSLLCGRLKVISPQCYIISKCVRVYVVCVRSCVQCVYTKHSLSHICHMLTRLSWKKKTSHVCLVLRTMEVHIKLTKG